MIRRSFFFRSSFMEIMMPALSPSMETGNLVKWNVPIGGKVTQGTSICSIQTDKAVVSFDHQMDDGFMAKVFAKEGDVVEVGKLIAILAEEEADVSKAGEFVPKPNSLPGSVAAEKPSAVQPIASSPAPIAPAVAKKTFGSLSDAIASSGPAVARIAREVGESTLKSIQPSGKNGRFTKGDLISLEGTVSRAPSAPEVPPVPPQSSKSFVVSVTPGRVYDFNVSDVEVLKKLFASSPVLKTNTVVKA